jgi:DNA ligase (NAD+)
MEQLRLNLNSDNQEQQGKEDKKSALKRIDELRKEIKRHNHLYYIENNTEIDDAEYDRLFRELKELENRYPEKITDDSPTQTVGAEITKEFKPIEHKVRLYSLSNATSEEDLIKWEERIRKNLKVDKNSPLEYVCELKIDGIAIALSYESGKLITGATRGDGKTGEDITPNIRTIKSIPAKIDIDSLEVRGEVYMPRSEFEKLNKQREKENKPLFANPRNAAGGSLRHLNPEITRNRNLEMFVYSGIMPDEVEQEIHTHYEMLLELKTMGFKVNPDFKKVNNIEEVIEYCRAWEDKRNNLDYATDGVVIKVNQFELQEKLGFTSHSPRWAIAYKYPEETAITTLKQIELNVTRTGAIVPVAILEPVQLAGSVVKRASLHNADEIARLDVREGDKVVVKKAAEIIPKVVRVESHAADSVTFRFPDRCPGCGSKTIRHNDDVNYYCSEPKKCTSVLKEWLAYWVSKDAMDIDGVGEKLINTFVDRGLVHSPSDIYEINYDNLAKLDRMKDKSINNILNAIEDSKNRGFSRLIAALGIKFVGKETAELLASKFNSIDELQKATEQEIYSIEGIGEKIARSIVEYFHDEENKTLIGKLGDLGLPLKNDGQKQAISNKILSDKTFVFTGKLTTINRSEVKDMVKNLGGKVLSSISSKTDFLVAGENPGSKFDKAQNLGVKVLTEEEFCAMINNPELKATDE